MRSYGLGRVCLRRLHYDTGAQSDLVEIGNKWKSKVLKGPILPKSGKDRNNVYILSMFPYPSGNLHIGHLRVYTITDALNRFYKQNGYNVIHPMGWDAFGLPAENAAIERKVNPASWTHQNIAKMKEQLNNMLANFDWDREVTTCNPDYYKHTQKLFLELFKRGLAYRKDAEINWDPVDQTVLANEQVDAQGRSWRSGALVEKRKLNQWFLGITKYAHALQHDLNQLQDWPRNVKTMQKNWVGESHGTEIDFKCSTSETIQVFTTRPETLFSVQYVALALDNPVIEKAAISDPELRKFIDQAKFLSPDCKDGYQLKGVKAKNPILKAAEYDLPIFAAPYVLGNYGKGAVMGCPAHDERDYAFWAQNMPGHPTKPSIVAKEDGTAANLLQLPFTSKSGILSSAAMTYAGMDTTTAAKQMTKALESSGNGRYMVSYKLRDWLISRQRYWGTPIPIIHCPSCGPVGVPDEHLPVLLPEIDGLATRGNPLQKVDDFVNTTCPSCGSPAKRETDTMDTFIDSSWYFFRFTDPKNLHEPFSHEAASKNLPVDFYIGGIEHAILHLLYSRFISKFLASIGKWDSGNYHGEPFKRLVTQGMVHGKTMTDPSTGRFLKPSEVNLADSSNPIIIATGQKPSITYEKMSKSKYNGADPDECIAAHGPDATRAHILFQAPISDILTWDESKIVGIERWLTRVLNITKALASTHASGQNNGGTGKIVTTMLNEEELSFYNDTQKLLHSITNSFKESLSLNTVISDYMKLTNLIESALKSSSMNADLVLNSLRILITSMYPIVPAISEEACDIINTELYRKWNIYEWPELQDQVASAVIKYQVVINGKMRFTHDADKSFVNDKDLAVQTLVNLPAGQKYLAGKTIKKLIVKGKVISFVI